MSLISDVLSNQILALAFSSVQPGPVKASDPNENFFRTTQQRKNLRKQSDSIVPKIAAGSKRQ